MQIAVHYAGIELKHPIMAAAAGITATVDRMRRAEDAGVSAICVKSLFENPIPRRGDPTPHMHVIRHGRGQRAVTLYSYEQAAHLDEFAYADLIRQAKHSLAIPVIANIDCATPEAWASYARLVEQAGADAVEVKSCPHGEHMMSGDELAATVAHVKSLVQIPVIAKMPSQLTNPYRSALDLASVGADALVMFNRHSGLDIDVVSCRPIMHGGFAGHGGPYSIYYRLRWIAQVADQLTIAICGTGGIASGEDVAKYLLAGATCVQLATAAITEGYGAFTRIIREFTQWMERGGHADVASVRGLAARRLLGIGEVERRQSVRAEIDTLACTECGLCERVCIYDAAHSTGSGSFAVGPTCVGCGLCVDLCPVAAIRLVGLA